MKKTYPYDCFVMTTAQACIYMCHYIIMKKTYPYDCFVMTTAQACIYICAIPIN